MDDSAHGKVMVVEKDPDVAQEITHRLASEGWQVELAAGPHAVLARLDAGSGDAWDVVLLDVDYPDLPGLPAISGIDVLRRFVEAGSPASIVMLTGANTAGVVATCMRAGAFYYLARPFQPYELSSVVEAAARHAAVRRELALGRRASDGATDPLLVGSSPALHKLRAALDRLASQDVAILLRGEPGTGKELVARALHERSARHKHRFVALHCGAIPEALIDSELFGHARGAFPGATADRPGAFVEADGGTLFLDEIGEMPMAVQARLLRVLQEGEVRPVGGSGVRAVDVRVIAATQTDLTAAVKQTRFRQDLFYRLNVVVLSVPPLRERLEDLPLLVAHFLRKHGGAATMSLSPEALAAMMSHAWPGNVRELENAILHAVALHQGDVIDLGSLPSAIASGRNGHNGRVPSAISIAALGGDDDQLPPLSLAKRRASAMFEKNYLTMAMERAKGSISEAARIAGLDRTNFRRLLQRHGIAATTFKS